MSCIQDISKFLIFQNLSIDCVHVVQKCRYTNFVASDPTEPILDPQSRERTCWAKT